MTLKNCATLGTCLIVLACIGCGPSGPEIAGVEGTVTMDGAPLPDASVVFVPENGRPAGATTDSSGHYVLTFTEGREGAMLGKNKVRISTQRDPSETPDGDPIPAKPETIPMRYNANTELEFTVEAGKKNIADFALESGGEVGAADTLVQESQEAGKTTKE